MRGFFDLLHSSVKQSRQRMYQVPPVFARLTEQQAVMEAIVAGDAEAARRDDGPLRLCPRHHQTF